MQGIYSGIETWKQGKSVVYIINKADNWKQLDCNYVFKSIVDQDIPDRSEEINVISLFWFQIWLSQEVL